jgi:parvulin-like peptidyl-prolyl isomerase
MKKIRWIMIVLSLVCCVCVLAFCFGAYFVKVDGVKLSVSSFNKKYAAAEAAYKEQGWELDNEQKHNLRVLIAQSMIMNELVKADLKANKWKDNVPEVKQYIQDSKNEQGKDTFKRYLDSIGMTEKQYRQCLAHRYYVTKDITVTEEDIKQYFNDSLNNPTFTELAESVTARHILVATEAEALEIIARVNAGEDFAALALEKSIEPATKNKGGFIGDFVRGVMKPEFEEAAFALQVDEISAPLKMEDGYHIIKVTDRKAAASLEDFDNHREGLEEDALQNAKDVWYDTVYRNLLDKASIEYTLGYEDLNADAE